MAAEPSPASGQRWGREGDGSTARGAHGAKLVLGAQGGPSGSLSRQHWRERRDVITGGLRSGALAFAVMVTAELAMLYLPSLASARRLCRSDHLPDLNAGTASDT